MMKQNIFVVLECQLCIKPLWWETLRWCRCYWSVMLMSVSMTTKVRHQHLVDQWQFRDISINPHALYCIFCARWWLLLNGEKYVIFKKDKPKKGFELVFMRVMQFLYMIYKYGCCIETQAHFAVCIVWKVMKTSSEE